MSGVWLWCARDTGTSRLTHVTHLQLAHAHVVVFLFDSQPISATRLRSVVARVHESSALRIRSTFKTGVGTMINV